MMTREEIPTLDILKTWEYVGGELPLHIKPHGWTPARCPVHGGFSASINQAANKWYCFGCEARGDGLDLIMEVEGVSLAEARERATESGLVAGGDGGRRGLARKPREGRSRGSLKSRAEGRRRDQRREGGQMLRPENGRQKAALMRAIDKFEAAYEGSPAEEYMHGRGIMPRTAQAHRVGFVDPARPLEGFERFAGRICIPYLNVNKEPV